MKLLDVFYSEPVILRKAVDNHITNTNNGVMQENTDINLEDQEIDEVYPGQSSGKLKNWIANHYGGKITCTKASKVKNDPNAGNFYKKRASWYQSLHCKGRKQIREDDPFDGAALTIFDIDDTLFKTDASVHVKNKNGEKRKLTTQEYNKHTLSNDESYDFSEFKDAKRFNATSVPIENIWKTALTTLNNIEKQPGSRVVIVTARPDLDDKDLFLDTFRKHGLDMDKIHVYRAGNIMHGDSADKKKIVIRNLLQSGQYTEVRLFDDHKDNLAAFLELSEEFPGVTFKAFPVDKSGNISPAIVLCSGATD